MGAGVSTFAEDKKHESSCDSAAPSPRGAWGDAAGAPSGMPLFLQPQVQMKCAECAKEDEKQTHHDPIQKKCAECDAEGSNEAAAPDVAAGGVSSANRPLPHLDRIQASFGRHDISETSAAVGGDAAKANESMGSLAYTAGDRVAFRSEPDVNLAAHEAAHVVQQRNGAKLPDGVGRPGDAYEQQADAAANAVERGESAEPILDHGLRTGGGEAASTVQHRLEANATRVMEPPARSSPNVGGSPVAGRAPAPKPEKKDEKRAPKPDADEPDSGGAGGGKAGARVPKAELAELRLQMHTNRKAPNRAAGRLRRARAAASPSVMTRTLQNRRTITKAILKTRHRRIRLDEEASARR